MSQPSATVRRSMLALLLPAAMLTSNGCAPTAGPSDECAGWEWIEVSEQDLATMSADLAQQVRAHNEYWLARCEP